MDRRIIWTERSAGDIEAIGCYISRRNPQAAAAIGMGIYDRVQILNHEQEPCETSSLCSSGWNRERSCHLDCRLYHTP